jgi:hypothetical protein
MKFLRSSKLQIAMHRSWNLKRGSSKFETSQCETSNFGTLKLRFALSKYGSSLRINTVMSNGPRRYLGHKHFLPTKTKCSEITRSPVPTTKDYGSYFVQALHQNHVLASWSVIYLLPAQEATVVHEFGEVPVLVCPRTLG